MSRESEKETSPRPQPSARYEIQIHPSDIQRRVKYLFLSRNQLTTVGGVVGLFLGFLIFSAVITPQVVSSLLSGREYQGLFNTRTLLGERLEALHGRLSELSQEGESLQLRMNKIYLAYGLANDGSIGQGGYPIEPRPATDAIPDSIYAEQVTVASQVEARLQEQARVLEAFLQEIQVFEQEHQDQVATTPSTSPLRGDSFVLTSPFGSRRNPFTKASDFHAGIDLAAPVGLPVYAPGDGVVSFAGRYSPRQSVAWWRYGNLVAVRNGERFITLYGHLSEVKVRPGQRVQQGDVIGTVGNTGWSTNPHLHYEVRRLDEEGRFQPVDPRLYILDHRWRDEEQLLVRVRAAPRVDFEPLPSRLRR